MVLMATNLIVVAVPDRFEIGPPGYLRSVQLTPHFDELGHRTGDHLFAVLPTTNRARSNPKQNRGVGLLQVRQGLIGRLLP